MVSVLGTFSRFCLHCASLARLSSFHRRSASASPSMERSPSSRNPITSFWKVASTSEASAKSFWTLSLSFVAAPWQGERGQSLVPSPAPSSRLCGIPLTLHHPFTQELGSQHSCQGTWLGTATYCCTTFGVPKQESDVFHKGQRGQTPHEPEERRCRRQRMPWHDP